MEKILITGASGFIGSFIVEEALRRGFDTWAAMRRSSKKDFLTDPRINFIELNLSSQERLTEQLRDHEFDYVVHAAGVTKCLDPKDFYRINTEGTKNLVNALLTLKMPLKRFVYISSLSIFGAIREKQPYEESRETDTPKPNTHYGRSKLQAEQWLDSLKLEMKNDKYGNSQAHSSAPEGNHISHLSSFTFPYVVLRPTGVYGPRERDYFLMAQSIKQHTDFAVGYRRQDITFVYVLDVVQAVFLACERGQTGRKYFLSDGQVYQSSTFSNLIRRELGNPWWIRVKAPIWVLRIITFFGDKIGHLTGKITALNNDKYHILKQRNWRCDIQPAIDELGYKPQYTLEQGVPITIQWYKDNGWL